MSSLLAQFVQSNNRLSERVLADIKMHADHVARWPQTILEEMLLSCCTLYCEATMYTAPLVCACCSHAHFGVKMFDIMKEDCLLFDLDLLQITDKAFICNWIVGQLSIKFTFRDYELDCLMLDHHGMQYENDKIVLQFCHECSFSLKKMQLPKFAWKNNLYIGTLPEYYCDLTWVEEMLCCLYCTTAHVMCIYSSGTTDGSFVYHRNVCVHETNMVSVVNELPQKPADVNRVLSVLFIGPKCVQDLKKMKLFHMCKEKVWAFLLLEKHVNLLFKYVTLSQLNMDLYGDEGQCKQECIWEDVNLFNLRRIKSDVHHNSINLKKSDFLDLVVIVQSNLACEALSNIKCWQIQLKAAIVHL
jgi:hypothetical protein